MNLISVQASGESPDDTLFGAFASDPPMDIKFKHLVKPGAVKEAAGDGDDEDDGEQNRRQSSQLHLHGIKQIRSDIQECPLVALEHLEMLRRYCDAGVLGLFDAY